MPTTAVALATAQPPSRNGKETHISFATSQSGADTLAAANIFAKSPEPNRTAAMGEHH